MINSTSAGIVNYRGHGSFSDWGSDMISRDNYDLWHNADKPTIILSADCLDSNFAWVETSQSISETFMQIDTGGSVAHWGSTGLGFTSEHSVLHSAFYESIFTGEAQRMGDATVASKIHYINKTDFDLSEIYAFTLHGDPALRIKAPDSYEYALSSPDVSIDSEAGETSSYSIIINNIGPVDDTFTVVISGNGWQVEVSQSELSVAASSSAVINVSHLIPSDAEIGASDTVTITVTSAGTNLSESITITSSVQDPNLQTEFPIFLPYITKK